MKFLLKSFLLVWAFQIHFNSLSAQCFISTNGVACAGQPIIFNCNSPGSTNINWDFNGEGTNNVNISPFFTFNNPGVKLIKVSLKLPNGSTCNAQLTLTIMPSPEIKSSMISLKKQCFFDNKFCFVDSSTIAGDSICFREYLMDDGVKYEFTGNKKVQFCHSFQDPAGGNYGYTVRVYSCNGCYTSKRFDYVASTQASLGLFISSPVPKACDSVELVITNNSTTPLDSLQSFEWDWGDGTKTSGTKLTPALWKVQIKHVYHTQGPNNGFFDVKLSAVAKNGCKDVYTFSNAAFNSLTPKSILASADSVCYSNAQLNFSLKNGPIPGSSNPLYIFETPPTPNNIKRDWSGSHRFSKPGPHLIKFSYTSTIPGCGKTITDTILVVGPQSLIELGGSNSINTAERFQCTIKDSVHFTNFSRYYHNDGNMRDDDSVILKPGGFNSPLTHAFNFSAQSSLNPVKLKRDLKHIDIIWNTDDIYCEPCTSDIKNNININKNCRYSKDVYPVHKYTDWEDIYTRFFAAKSIQTSTFNKDSGYAAKKSLWADDSVAIVRDTLLYYANNPWGISARDSSIYKNVKKYPFKYAFVTGTSRQDISHTTRIYLKAGQAAQINPNNGAPPSNITGPGYRTLIPGVSVSTSSVSDTIFFTYTIEYRQDTVPSYKAYNNKNVWKRIPTPGFQSTDIVNMSLHRKKFYESSYVRCFDITLNQKDTIHPLACASENNVKLSLSPPSASNLRIEGIQCLGASQSDYGVTFVLDDTKPGCSMTWASVKIGNDWVPLVDKNLSSGSMSMGGLPPVNPPYLNAPGASSPGSRYSTNIDRTGLPDNTGVVDVSLIVGNGIHAGGNYPEQCQDTVHYPKLLKFPILEPFFTLQLGNIYGDYYSFCKNNPIAVKPFGSSPGIGNNINNPREIGNITYTLFSDNAGKFNNKVYTQTISETYKRFQYVSQDSSFMMDSLILEKTSSFDGVTNTKTRSAIAVARINKWHVMTNLGNAFGDFKSQLSANGINIFEIDPSDYVHLIWNGKGNIGKAYTGSRGIVDTSGFGHKLSFEFISDERVKLHWRDTSILPLDSFIAVNNVVHRSYLFIPKFAGSYVVTLKIRSNDPKQCEAVSAEKALVGFYMNMGYQDTIICPGQSVLTHPMLRYYNPYPEIITTNCPSSGSGLLDCVDYWRDRIAEAGNVNREGYTRTDLSKDDDGTHIQSIFGGFPYSMSGLDNKPGNILELSSPFGLYYNQDTGKVYTIRTAASDSNGCRDTFTQNLYVIAHRSKTSILPIDMSCGKLINLNDSIYFQNPQSSISGISDQVTKMTINWGDNSVNKVSTFFNPLPAKISHQYARSGQYDITVTHETNLGCSSVKSYEYSIAGPQPMFDTLFKSEYCIRDTVVFKNTSTGCNPSDSCLWTWDLGDLTYINQSLPINSPSDWIKHKYQGPGSYPIYLHLNYKIKTGNTFENCVNVYPNFYEQDKNKIVKVIKCDPNSIDNHSDSAYFLMHPNPASQTVQFTTLEPLTLQIINSLGQVVATLTVDGTVAFDLSGLNSGLYIVKTLDQRYVGRLIVNHE